LKKAGISGKALLVVDKRDATVSQAFGNIADIKLIDAAAVNAWQLMASRKVYFTKAALDELAKRWPKG
jgi:ribosomal protein L4